MSSNGVVPQSELTDAEARLLTDEINKVAEVAEAQTGLLVRLIGEAHDKRAWLALGYSSWSRYVDAELYMSRSRAYQIVDQWKVVAELAEVASIPIDDMPLITEREARRLAPQLPEVGETLAVGVVDVPVEDRPAKVKEVVTKAAAPHSRRESVHQVDNSPAQEMKDCPVCHGVGKVPVDAAPPVAITTPIHRITDRLDLSKPRPLLPADRVPLVNKPLTRREVTPLPKAGAGQKAKGSR
jgi:hypothetical protein